MIGLWSVFVAGDIAVTTDIPLAGRCLSRGCRVLSPKGSEFTEDAIGDALATRALLEMLRQSGDFGGGPAPFTQVGSIEVLVEARRNNPRDSPSDGEVRASLVWCTIVRSRRGDRWLPSVFAECFWSPCRLDLK